MLTRSIDIDPFDLPIEKKLVLGAKRICTVFAVSAVTLGAFDLMNIRSADDAAAFIHNSQMHVADWPARIRTEIGRISFVPASASATVAIPRDDIAETTRPTPTSSVAVKDDASPVAGLASVRHQDAVEFAMALPVSYMKSELRVAAEPPPAASMPAPSTTPPSQPIILASVDPGSLTSSSASTSMSPAPVSLPMSAAIPLGMVPMPRAAPGLPPPSPAERLHLEGKDRAKAERCLANAVYFESRSEPVRGQMAVAQVVMNRVFSGFYPNDICGVVYQNASHHLACQFTFACDGKRKLINERGAWARANRIARETLDGQIYVPEVAKSTHYHAIYVHPNWVHEMKKMVRYGIHNFYRPYAWGNGAEEPVWGSGVVASNTKKK